MLLDDHSKRVAGKELALFFASPVAWLFLGSFAAVGLFVFFWGEAFFARNIADVVPLFQWMPILLIFLCSALTMRMWSEERRAGTLEHVLTLPVPLWRFALGKFLACLALLGMAVLITLPLPLTVAWLGDLDWGPVLAAYLATLLMGAAYIAIGLFVSARSDNPIVSLIGSVVICGLFYLIGSDVMTSFFGNRAGEWMRGLGTGARFDAITRGVIDLRDLVYYLSLVLVFLSLNILSLERERWSRLGGRDRHRRWRLATALVAANALLFNLWLSPLGGARLDVTEGRLFSISAPTHQYLEQLREPLLMRGYFSAKTHPLLAPLVPQLRDLMKEYEVAGGGKLRVEFVDPVDEPELEDEANNKYGIRAVPFQVADRYQSAVVNSYFNVLVEYGDSFQMLDFEDMIEVKSSATNALDVQLRNPEFNLTRAIRQAIRGYHAGGNLFDNLESDIELVGYVSADERLPEPLRDYKGAIQEQLRERVEQSQGRLEVRFVEPEANDGEVARRIAEDWGFNPMVTSPLAGERFYFYLTLADERQTVQIPVDDFNPDNFQQALDAGLKRFASGFTRTVSLATPDEEEPQLGPQDAAGSQFRRLEQVIGKDHSVLVEELGDGAVAAEADLLVVVAPSGLDDRRIFAIDQFLMRGGTVVLASSPYRSQFTQGGLNVTPHDSGLRAWLGSHGISMADRLVLDPQNSAFPVTVTRQAGIFNFQNVELVDYPYFIDARGEGLNQAHPVTGDLPQVTMAWPSPIRVDEEANGGRQVTPLVKSSGRSWTSASLDVLPRITDERMSGWQPEGETGAELLGVIVSGRFDSFFAGKVSPLLEEEGGEPDEEGDPASLDAEAGAEAEEDAFSAGGVIEKSTEAARLVVFASNDFLSDQILRTMSSMSGTDYLGPLELLANSVDWAFEDSGLLGIRSGARFNRTLPPLEREQQAFWEYLNYALAVLALLALGFWQRWLRARRAARYLAQLGGA